MARKQYKLNLLNGINEAYVRIDALLKTKERVIILVGGGSASLWRCSARF